MIINFLEHVCITLAHFFIMYIYPDEKKIFLFIFFFIQFVNVILLESGHAFSYNNNNNNSKMMISWLLVCTTSHKIFKKSYKKNEIK